MAFTKKHLIQEFWPHLLFTAAFLKRFEGLSTFYYSMQLFTFLRRGFLGFRKRSKPHGILEARTYLWFVSLPETE